MRSANESLPRDPNLTALNSEVMELIQVEKSGRNHYIHTRFIRHIWVDVEEDGDGVITIQMEDTGTHYKIHQGSGLYRDTLAKLQLEKP